MPKSDISDLIATAESIEQAILTRRSIRRFLPEPVKRETVEHLLEIASHAPSGTNMQPWRVYVITGEAKEGLTAAILEAHNGGYDLSNREYKYYPSSFPEPYKSRRRKVGWDLYGLLGIKRVIRIKCMPSTVVTMNFLMHQ